MDIVLPSFALKLIPRSRWLVIQTTTDGKVVYAQTYLTRNRAEKAAEEADKRVRFWSSRQRATVLRLTYDTR